MCDMVVVAYNTILPIHVPFLDHDIALAERLNAESLQNHPNGAIYLYFAARIAFIKTETDKAIDYFQRSIASQSEWEQLHHICFWDLSQCYSIQMEYGRAADIMLRLAEKSRWSKAIYYYLR